MAEQWYLINSNHDTVSGFESDDFDYYTQDAFREALESSLGDDIKICRYDMEVLTSTRAIPVGGVSDTKLKSTTRQLLLPIGTCQAGQYIYYEDKYWLIVNYVDNNKVYEKAIIYLCNYLLSWKSISGDVIQRWVSLTSASQYNNGETGDKTYVVRSDQLMVLTPDDDECLLMPHNQRVIIDRRCEIYERNYLDRLKAGEKFNLMVYKLTRLDNVIYNYQGSGHSEFMATQTEQGENDGYCEIGEQWYWLCAESDDENPPIPPTPSEQYCSILCDEPIIYVGLESTIFTAKFYGSDGKENYLIPQWEINCDFVDKLNVKYTNSAIIISVDDEKLINNSFELLLNADNYESDSITVKIKEFI